VNVAMDAPRRPALRYYGGKWNLAGWIISFFPPHLNYVEPCGGAASVLLQKPRSLLETYNDLDNNVVNFFRVLRDQPDELSHKIRLTPWARAEYEMSYEPSDDPVEWARRYFIRSYMSFNGSSSRNGRTFGWRHTSDSRLRMPAAYDLINNALDTIAERLTGVQVENTDYADIISRLDNDAALIYFDPPYVEATRTKTDWYLLDWKDTDHIAAADLLHAAVGYVVISGYACPLYTELYERHGWQRHDKEAQTNSGGKRIESVWLSPRTVEVLARPKQSDLFQFAEVSA
jgi:DNA adenine methylase